MKLVGDLTEQMSDELALDATDLPTAFQRCGDRLSRRGPGCLVEIRR